MNTDKTLNNKFIEGANDRDNHRIWYYKELKEVEIDYVVWNLLKETFVVDIDGSKHEITFGKNRKGEIGQCITYDEMRNSNLSSYKIVQKGFREGKWYIITDKDTTPEFKKDYEKKLEEYKKEETKDFFKGVLINAIELMKIDDRKKEAAKLSLDNFSYDELETAFNNLMSKFDK